MRVCMQACARVRTVCDRVVRTVCDAGVFARGEPSRWLRAGVMAQEAEGRGTTAIGHDPPGPPRVARRKLKRRLSRGSLPVEVKDVTCIKGGSCRMWQVVPVVEYLGERCVAIVSSHRWLHTLLMGQMHRSVYTGAIINFVDDCRLAMQRLGASSSGAPATSHAAAVTNHAAAKSKAAKPAGRAAVFWVRGRVFGARPRSNDTQP